MRWRYISLIKHLFSNRTGSTVYGKEISNILAADSIRLHRTLENSNTMLNAELATMVKSSRFSDAQKYFISKSRNVILTEYVITSRLQSIG